MDLTAQKEMVTGEKGPATELEPGNYSTFYGGVLALSQLIPIKILRPPLPLFGL